MMAKDKKESASPTPGQEVIAVIGIFTALFLFISLVSYSPAAAVGLFPEATGNWGGKFGYFTAHILTGMLGINAFWLVFLFLLSLFVQRDGG